MIFIVFCEAACVMNISIEIGYNYQNKNIIWSKGVFSGETERNE